MYSRNTNNYEEIGVVSDFDDIQSLNGQQHQAPPVPKPRRDVSPSSNFFDCENDGFAKRDGNICYLNVNGVKMPFTKIINKNGEEEYIRQSFEMQEQQNLARENAFPQHCQSSVSPHTNDIMSQQNLEDRFLEQFPLTDRDVYEYAETQEIKSLDPLDEMRQDHTRNMSGYHLPQHQQQRRNVTVNQHHDTSASPHQNRTMLSQQSPKPVEYAHDYRETTPVSYSIQSGFHNQINLPPQEFANPADPNPFILDDINANLRCIYQQLAFIENINLKIDRFSEQISRLEDMKKKLDHVEYHLSALLDMPKQHAALSESIYTLQDAINIAAAKSIHTEPKISAGKANAEISKPAAQRKAEKARSEKPEVGDEILDSDDAETTKNIKPKKSYNPEPIELAESKSTEEQSILAIYTNMVLYFMGISGFGGKINISEEQVQAKTEDSLDDILDSNKNAQPEISQFKPPEEEDDSLESSMTKSKKRSFVPAQRDVSINPY